MWHVVFDDSHDGVLIYASTKYMEWFVLRVLAALHQRCTTFRVIKHSIIVCVINCVVSFPYAHRSNELELEEAVFSTGQ